ncbi:MAG: hypothetical protein A2Y24_08430 [Clostridiales bacterium GWE2_32_10]|nr:MAG: hypothetical protein A2Y24_08430 [Clostridiales bacterium GWE2_32_10]HBY21123.1 hypothetical protein [Clostridiales bacterium]
MLVDWDARTKTVDLNNHVIAFQGNNGKYGFIDINGDIVVDAKYDGADVGFHEGVALVLMGTKHGYVDKDGKEIIPLIYDNAYISVFDNGVAIVKRDEKYGVINKNGKEVVECKYDYCDSCNDCCDLGYEGIYAIELNNKWAYVNKEGEQITDFIYDSTMKMDFNLN